MSGQCPATTRYAAPGTGEITGLQCKYATPHDGDHCAAPPGGGPDLFWPQDDPGVIVRTVRDGTREAEEAHLRAMAEAAMAHPGQFVHGM